MKLDPSVFRYLDRDAFRVLIAVEMGMKNHQWVSAQLIESIAGLKRGNTFKVLSLLLKHKLISHQSLSYHGYKLTYNGYDFLALRALVGKGHIKGVGSRIGVGKESDIHVCEGSNGEKYALKLHRLGRVSFRSIKKNRDYLQHRTHASWMFMARLAATKEYAYLKALKQGGFRVPTPIEHNRHAILMKFVEAKPLYHVRVLEHPYEVLEKLMLLLVRLARAGLVHGDFNEFNLMIDAKERVTLIDFPQVVPTTHPSAQLYFDRDVQCIRDFFARRFCIQVELWPEFEAACSDAQQAITQGIENKEVEEVEDIIDNERAAEAIRAVNINLKKEDDNLLTTALEDERNQRPEGDTEPIEHDDDEEEDEEENDDESHYAEVGELEDELNEEQTKAVGVLFGGAEEMKVVVEGEEMETHDDVDEDKEDSSDDGSEFDEDNQPGIDDQIGVLKRKKKVVRQILTAEDIRKQLNKKAKQRAKPNNTKNMFKRKHQQEARAAVKDSL